MKLNKNHKFFIKNKTSLQKFIKNFMHVNGNIQPTISTADGLFPFQYNRYTIQQVVCTPLNLPLFRLLQWELVGLNFIVIPIYKDLQNIW